MERQFVLYIHLITGEVLDSLSTTVADGDAGSHAAHKPKFLELVCPSALPQLNRSGHRHARPSQAAPEGDHNARSVVRSSRATRFHLV